MDNDNKVELQTSEELETHKEVQLFLKDELETLGYSKAASYNLETEYAKTRKNRNKTVYIIIMVCFAVVLLLTVSLSEFIKYSNNRIRVNIDTFDDLNLKTLLNSAGQAEDLYKNALKTKELLEAQKKDELDAAEQKRDNDLFTMRSVAKVSSKKALAEKQSLIQEEYEKTIKSIKTKYDKKLAEADEKISVYEAKVHDFDADAVNQAKETEGDLDSQKMLNDLEKENIIKNYETRINELKTQMTLQQREAVKQQREAVEEVRRIYQAKIDLLDPDARSQSKVQDKIILGTGIPKEAKNNPELIINEKFDGKAYTSRFVTPSENFVSSINKSAEALEKLDIVAERFASIPLENSIYHYAPAMQHLAREAAELMAEGQVGMQQEINGLKETIDKKNQQISDLGVYFDKLCAQDKNAVADGIVISCSGKKKFNLYLTKAGQNKIPESGMVRAKFQTGKKVLCQVTVIKEGESFYAITDEGEKPAVLDQISDGSKLYIQ